MKSLDLSPQPPAPSPRLIPCLYFHDNATRVSSLAITSSLPSSMCAAIRCGWASKRRAKYRSIDAKSTKPFSGRTSRRLRFAWTKPGKSAKASRIANRHSALVSAFSTAEDAGYGIQGSGAAILIPAPTSSILFVQSTAGRTRPCFKNGMQDAGQNIAYRSSTQFPYPAPRIPHPESVRNDCAACSMAAALSQLKSGSPRKDPKFPRRYSRIGVDILSDVLTRIFAPTPAIAKITT